MAKLNIFEIFGNIPSDLSENLKVYCPSIGKYCLISDGDGRYPIRVFYDSPTELPSFELFLTAYGTLDSNFPNGEPFIYPSCEHMAWDGWQEVLFRSGHYVTDGNVIAEVSEVKKDSNGNATLVLRSYIPASDSMYISFPSPNIRGYRFANGAEIAKFKDNCDKRILVMPNNAFDGFTVVGLDGSENNEKLASIQSNSEKLISMSTNGYAYQSSNNKGCYPKYHYLTYNAKNGRRITICGCLTKEKIPVSDLIVKLKGKKITIDSKFIEKKRLSIGYAICSKEDEYIEEKGKHIAMQRSHYRKIGEIDSKFSGQFYNELIKGILLSTAKHIEQNISKFIKNSKGEKV